jgi:polar amino acid transport system substrate-binding protein
MKIYLKSFIILLLFTIVFSLHSQGAAKKLVVGTSAVYPPFAFMKQGKIVGFDIDLINTIAQNLGYELDIKDIEFKDLFHSLENGDIDIIVAAITVTQERMKKFRFSGRYYFPFHSVIHRKDNNIYTVNDLDGKIVGVLAGSSMEDFLVNILSKNKKIKIVKFTDNQFMLESLRKKEIDAILSEDADAKLADKSYEEISYFLIRTPRPDGYAIVFRGNSELENSFNDELVSLKASAQLEALKEKWGL